MLPLRQLVYNHPRTEKRVIKEQLREEEKLEQAAMRRNEEYIRAISKKTSKETIL